jgi:hypothetical protein
MNDTEINALVKRLSRPHPAGTVVIERAAILASGADSTAVIDWILAHSGAAEAPVVATRSGGLHGSRMNSSSTAVSSKPLRFVLPADTLA